MSLQHQNPPEQVPVDLLTLYTIGHSNLSAEDFLKSLKQHGITVLVDVRSAPFSRYVPHFNKNQLEIFLPAHQISYRFAGEWLGGRPPYADVYRDGKIPDPSTPRPDFLKLVQYERIMERDWYQRGIHRLLEVVREIERQGGNVAVMCSEADPKDCHRHHLIARSLIDPKVRVPDYPPIQVKHILRDDHSEPKDVVPADFETFEQQKMF